MSHRCDAAITAHRFALFEIDLPEIDLPTQAAFLRSRIASGWPVRAITYSGGKSLHAVLQVDCTDAEQWADIVQGQLFPIWEGLGADPQCRNPSRLSRLPGHIRENGNLQALLWLAPDGWTPTEQPKASQDEQKPRQGRVNASNTNPHPSKPSRPSCGDSAPYILHTATSDSTTTSTGPEPDTATSTDSTRPRFTLTDEERAFLDFHLFWPHAPMY